MKTGKHKRTLTLTLACVLTLSPASANFISGITAPGLTHVQAAKKPPKKGWYTTPKKNRQYYRRGKFVTGLQKIRNNYYYFNKKGIMQTGTVKCRKVTYYLNDKGIVEASHKKSSYYYGNGKKMSKTDAQDFQTLLTAKSIVKQITNSRMSQAEKLKKCFDWVISKPYVTRRTFANTAGWPALYANDHFLLGGGNCFADAAAFAYLAKALGYKKVYVCVDCDGSGGRGHAWAEINGLAYDPLFAESKSYAANYGVPYGTYILHPILHIAL